MAPAVLVSLMLASAVVDVPSAGPSTAPAVSPAPTPVSAAPAPWLGLSLGESSHDVRTSLGKPLEIVATSAGDLWRYDYDDHKVGLELLFDQDQLVNIAARIKPSKQSSLADPFGGALGMSASALASARGTPIASYDDGASLAYGSADGVRWFYSLDSGAVSAIEESKPLPPTPPPAQVLADATHDGSSIAKALVVTATDDADATNDEYVYIRGLSCGTSGSWQVTTQRLIEQSGKYYDQLHAVCTETKTERDFYFDITAGYGK